MTRAPLEETETETEEKMCAAPGAEVKIVRMTRGRRMTDEDRVAGRPPFREGQVKDAGRGSFRAKERLEEAPASLPEAPECPFCDGVETELPGKTTLRLRRGDRLVVETPGGGGWGTSDA